MTAAAVPSAEQTLAAGTAVESTAQERRIAWLFGLTGLALFAVMGLLGLGMRLTQAEVLGLSDAWFYRFMTLHGAGMLVGALLAMMGGLWFVLRPVAAVGAARMLWAYGLILVGAVAVVVAVLLGGFATGWTFLAPLPFRTAGEWDPWATATFLAGMALVGAGFFVFCLDVLAKSVAAAGGLGRALGLPFLAGRDVKPPPPQLIAATVVSLEGALASAVGTTVVMALIGRTIDSGVEIDALWAKNLTYFFGHSVANLIIYLAAGLVYVLVPRYTGRPWKTSKPLVAGWLGTLVFVTTAYSHHLYMDFVQPEWAQYVSMIASFAAALPVAVVTVYTGMMLVWGSRYRWTLASTLLYLGFAGWTIGGSAAVIDSVIPLNFRLHNTLWVPGHFHTYLMLGVVFWMMALVVHLLERAADRPASRAVTIVAPATMAIGGYGLVFCWYISGALGIPRRYAVHPEGTDIYSVVASVFVVVFAVGFLVLLWEALGLARIAWARRRERAAGAQGEPARAAPAAGPGARVATPAEVAAVVGAAALATTAFYPVVVDAAEAGVRWHHLDHAGQFAYGALLGFAIAASIGAFRRDRWPRTKGFALAVIVVAPAAMLLAMVPSVYGGLADSDGLHLVYHLGVAALGWVTGFAVTSLGRGPAWLTLFLSIAMATTYAGGVAGG